MLALVEFVEQLSSLGAEQEQKECDVADADVLDCNAADDSRAYHLKLSKWYQGTFDSIRHPIFWYLLTIARCMRSPLRHFLAFVQLHAQKNNSGEVIKQLVTGKLDELQEEFRVIFHNMDKITARAAEMSSCNELFRNDPSGLRKLELIARKVVFQQWSAFQRRILYPLRQLLDVQ